MERRIKALARATSRGLSTVGQCVVLTIAMASSSIPGAGSTCVEDQLERCRQTGTTSTCIPNEPYGSYTHKCMVPGTNWEADFCCCKIQSSLLCCSYKNSGNLYRCSDTDDVVPSSQALSTLTLAIMGAVAAGILVIALVTALALWCRRRKRTSATGKAPIDSPSSSAYHHPHQSRALEDPERQPLRSVSLSSGDQPHHHPQHILRMPSHTLVEPSAPPAEALGILDDTLPRSRTDDHVIVADHVPMSVGDHVPHSPCHACPNCGHMDPVQLPGYQPPEPPPPYDAHQNDRTVTSCPPDMTSSMTSPEAIPEVEQVSPPAGPQTPSHTDA